MWTKLKDTELWKRAETAYAAPEGRHYHNMGHVMRLYEVAEETAVPYDRALDLAILAHDAIYDEKPQKERRSADWLLENAGAEEDPGVIAAAEHLVMTTAHHIPGEDNRLILLDLHDLGDREVSLRNRELLVAEFLALMGVGRQAFLAGNSAFMTGMADGLENGLSQVADPDERAAFSRIISGIRDVFVLEDGPSF